jgi:epoxyqueuosine reductase|tara:strand:- start:311 stop:1366 length:1056 start_codon:yes stop_codon:yes gene_type:complete
MAAGGIMADDLKKIIRAQAHGLGFDVVGFANAEADPRDARALSRFLADGRQGDMAWLVGDGGRRGDPKALMPEAKTVIVLGANYGPRENPLAALARPGLGAISVYARGRDYHHVLKKKCKRLGRWIADNHGGGIKVFVDTAPVMEKPLAARAGIGWQGKHTNLLSRDFGSWLFLAEVFTTLDLPPDAPAADHCGGCDRCLRACPTDALPEPYRIDPRLCISYLTIEHKGAIAPGLMARMGNRIHGCDDCLAVCPWNKFGRPSADNAFLPRFELTAPRLADLAALDEPKFRELFAGSPVKRTGRDRFVRNVLIAIGNSGDRGLLPAARALLGDPSELVAEAARWAVDRLAGS